MPHAILHGTVTFGDVNILWQDGIPLRAELRTNLARWAYVPPEFWAAMVATVRDELLVPFTYIAFLESDYRADAHNPSAAEDSWGPLQINRNAWPQYTVDELTTYEGNLRAAQFVYDQQGFGAWSTAARMLNLPLTAPPLQPGGAPGAPPAIPPAGGARITIALDAIALAGALDAAAASLHRAATIIDAARPQAPTP